MGKILGLLESIGVGIISAILVSYLIENLTYIILVLVSVTIAVSIVIFIYRRYPKYFGKKGSFAVTALIFNGDKILLIFHPRQKMWIPPGMHLKDSLKPHEEILKAVNEETGYNVEFHPYHKPAIPKVIDRFSTEVPQPFYIMEETQLSREGHDYHYDLFYICEIKDNDDEGVPRGSHKMQWVPINELEKFVQENKTYPDVHRVASKAFKGISP